jgi:hypothetical protein
MKKGDLLTGALFGGLLACVTLCANNEKLPPLPPLKKVKKYSCEAFALIRQTVRYHIAKEKVIFTITAGQFNFQYGLHV